MMEDLVIALLIICMIAVPFLIIAGIAELVIFPFLDRRAEKRKEAEPVKMPCIYGSLECNGCGSCTYARRVVAVCAVCGKAICGDEDYYDLDGETIHEDCVIDWAKNRLVRGKA